MNGLVEGVMRFVAKDGEALTTLQSVAAMVAELEKLGAQPVVSVTVELGSDSTRQSNSTPIIVGMGSFGPDAWRISNDQVRMLSQEETPFSPVGLVSAVSASPVFGSSSTLNGEGFLSTTISGTSAEIDWSGLTAEEQNWRRSLEEGRCSIRKVPRSVKRVFAWTILSQLPFPRTQFMFDQAKPAWMKMIAGNVPELFGLRWSELVQCIKDGDHSIPE